MRYFKVSVILIVLMAGFLPQKLFAQNEAIFLLSPDSGTYNKGDKFSVDLKFNSQEPITSIKSYLEFNPSFIKVDSIDSTSGVFPYWWENNFNNNTGKIQLQASLPAPGETEGPIAKINFQAVRGGEAAVTFDASSLALKPSDENVLNLVASAGAQFSLVSPSLSELLGTKNLIIILSVVLTALAVFLILKKKRLFKIA